MVKTIPTTRTIDGEDNWKLWIQEEPDKISMFLFTDWAGKKDHINYQPDQ